MLKLNVKLRFPNNTLFTCGEIITEEPDSRGFINGAFRYTSLYLEHPLAFALDPVNLPLSPREFQTKRSQGVHAVFEDALPDDWGKQLLIKSAKLNRRDQTIPKLLEVLGANGLGALIFEAKRKISLKNPCISIKKIESVLNAALRYDAGLHVENKELELLFRHGSSPGGARPKVLVQKNKNSLWIAKFPKHNDSFDVQSIEASTLEIAKAAGLIVPDFEILDIGKRKILLIKRFDISKQGGRYHMISMETLLRAKGYYHVNYNDLFDVIKSCSIQPVIDTTLLFKQMVFNVAMGNTDDHLKNFTMLHKESGYSLSPVYDLLPDIYERREHTLSFPGGAGSLPPDRQTLNTAGRYYNIAVPGKIIDEVVQAVSKWCRVFQNYGVNKMVIQQLGKSINQRIKYLQ